MKKIVFLDTETTGNEIKKDFLCQLAYKTKDDLNKEETFCELYKPPIHIPPEASAITHITDKTVADKKKFQESKDYRKIKDLLENKDTVMVAHNAKFDYEMIKKEGITPANVICTLRVARALDRNNIIPQYRLQYLRYYLDIDIEAEAHDALGDVLVLEKLFERLLSKMIEELKDENKFSKEESTETSRKILRDEAIERMIKISSHPSLMNIFNFGKHNGEKVSDVARNDREYLEWMLAQKEQNEENEEDWVYTLRHHLGMLE